MLNFCKYILVAALLQCPILAYPVVVHVPAEYSTIQTAVDAAMNGELLLMEIHEAAKAAMAIDISEQSGGVYYLIVRSNGQVLYRQKIIKI